MNNRVALLVAGADEIGDFLAGEVLDQLGKTLPGLIRLDTTDLTQESYARAITDHRPEIVVSCWSTPALSIDLCPSALAFLRYNCHLCGTIRAKIPKEFLQAGLLVTNWGSSIARSVAECALLLILSGLRRSTYWALEMHGGAGWKSGGYGESYGLYERRVGIHGFGAIARALVDLLRPFGVTIRAHSPSVPRDLFLEYDVQPVDTLEDLADWSDVMVELAPKRPEYHHVVDESVLRALRPGSVFVNVGRGACVDEEALARVAAEGRIQVGLDVYETEPLPADSPLRKLSNVALMPHLAGPTRDRRVDSGRLALDNIRRYLAGQDLLSQVTAETYDRIT